MDDDGFSQQRGLLFYDHEHGFLNTACKDR